MYEALYRKWRPQTFDDVISQEHITTTLKNQIVSGQTAHAYIFTGSRGTGKTTCARIFAKALNCKNPENGNPCLECEICRNADRLTDIIEIDAASNNGVDSIREIRDGLDYMPEQCKFKVYIIDEVHMLSTAAFNAFLKSIEEPPPHVKFIFATTEIQKVPATILSRCQRFDFRRVQTKDIAERLKYIISQEGLSITGEAAMLIGKISDGGMRDALSLLELCTAVSKDITPEVVSAAAGTADRTDIHSMLEAIFEKDIPKAFEIINRLHQKSTDLQNIAADLTEQLRNIMLLKLTPPQNEAVSCSNEEIKILSDISKNASLDDVMCLVSMMQDISSELSYAVNKRAEFEMKIISMINSPEKKTVSKKNNSNVQSQDVVFLKDKVRMLEQKIKSISMQAMRVPVQQQNSTSETQQQSDSSTVDFSKLKKEDFHPVQSWQEVLEKFSEYKPDVVGALGGSAAFINGNVMLIVTENRFFLRLFKVPENAEILKKVIFETLGRNYIIRAKCTASDEHKSPAERASEFIDNAKNSGVSTAVDNGGQN